MKRLLAGLGRGRGGGGPDKPVVDDSETVHISSLALLKMLKHSRAGVPMEVMGLMLGEYVDDYTVRVLDCFAMPQSGTGFLLFFSFFSFLFCSFLFFLCVFFLFLDFFFFFFDCCSSQELALRLLILRTNHKCARC